MRILVVTPSWPTPSAPYNGVFVREHCQVLVGKGHAVRVVAPRVFAETALFENDGGMQISRFRYPSGQRLLSEYASVPKVRMVAYVTSGACATRQAIRRFVPDVVVAHWLVPAGLVAGLAKPRKLPLIVVAHGGDLARANHGIVRRAARWVARTADEIVCVSDVLGAQVTSDLGADPARVHVAPMGVDLSTFKPLDGSEARRALGLKPDADVVLFVGNLSEAKGVPELLDAFGAVVSERPQAVLVLAGKGPLSGHVGALAARGHLPDDSVVELGPVAHDALPQLLAASDVLALPSHGEGLPVALMEGAAAGVPVVASDVGAVRTIVALDPASVLVQPGDVSGLRDGLLRILASKSAVTPREPRVFAGSAMDRATHIDLVLRLASQLSNGDAR